MPVYQNATVTDSKIEIGNYTISTHPTAGSTAAAAGWINLGAGMVKSLAYAPEAYTSQAGNAIDPIQGIARETATVEIDLIEYDGSSFSVFSNGTITGSTGSLLVGGQTNAVSGRGLKLVNTRKLAAGGTTQTTTYVINNAFMTTGFTMNPKSDNDADPVNVYSFSVLCKQYATAGTIFSKTVS
jgi:hypothetical protein